MPKIFRRSIEKVLGFIGYNLNEHVKERSFVENNFTRKTRLKDNHMDRKFPDGIAKSPDFMYLCQ